MIESPGRFEHADIMLREKVASKVLIATNTIIYAKKDNAVLNQDWRSENSCIV